MQGLIFTWHSAKTLLVSMLRILMPSGKVIAHLWPSAELPSKTGSLRFALSRWLTTVICHTRHTGWSHFLNHGQWMTSAKPHTKRVQIKALSPQHYDCVQDSKDRSLQLSWSHTHTPGYYFSCVNASFLFSPYTDQSPLALLWIIGSPAAGFAI